MARPVSVDAGLASQQAAALLSGPYGVRTVRGLVPRTVHALTHSRQSQSRRVDDENMDGVVLGLYYLSAVVTSTRLL